MLSQRRDDIEFCHQQDSRRCEDELRQRLRLIVQDQRFLENDGAQSAEVNEISFSRSDRFEDCV